MAEQGTGSIDFSTIPASTDNLLIGKLLNTTNLFFEGKIDDIRVYNRNLTSSEPDSLYTQGDLTTTLSSAKNIAIFDITGLIQGSLVLDNTNFTVDAVVAYGTDITNLTPTIPVSAGATISPY